jgi:hypothetical protein
MGHVAQMGCKKGCMQSCGKKDRREKSLLDELSLNGIGNCFPVYITVMLLPYNSLNCTIYVREATNTTQYSIFQFTKAWNYTLLFWKPLVLEFLLFFVRCPLFLGKMSLCKIRFSYWSSLQKLWSIWKENSICNSCWSYILKCNFSQILE